MDIRELDYILTIASEGSISKAAQRLFMAQSSLSQFLTKIEAELKTVLFIRTANGVRPTYAGEIFIENAKEMNLMLKRVKNQILDIEFLKAGKVELGISTFRGMYLLPKVLKEFNKLYPQIQVVIHEADSLELQNKIAKGEIDIALVAMREKSSDISRDDVMRDEVLLVCQETDDIMQYVNKIGADLFINPSDLKNVNFLLSPLSTVLGGIARDLFQKEKIHPNIVNDNLTAFFATSLARSGIGTAFTYNSCKTFERDEKYIKIKKEGTFVDLALIYPPDKYRSYATKILANLISDLF